MKNGRINERNIGNISLDGNLKKRNKKQGLILTDNEKIRVLDCLLLVYECLEYDSEMSECGQVSQEARFTDGGRFLANFSRKSYEEIGSSIEKLQKQFKK